MRAQGALGLCLTLLLVLTGCAGRGQSYDVGPVLRDLEEMLRQPSNLAALYDEYQRAPHFRGFLSELRTALKGSPLEGADLREILERALELVRVRHLEKVILQEPLLLSQYGAGIFVVLLTLERTEVERFSVGLKRLTEAAVAREAGVRPQVLPGLERALRAVRLRQPFLGASPPYAAQTHEDRLGEVAGTIEFALRLWERGWQIAGLYEQGRAKIARRFNHLQAVIDLVAAGPSLLPEGSPTVLFLQVEQRLDGTSHELKQAADRVEATAYYVQEKDWREDFALPLDSKPVVALVIEESSSELERVWREIESRPGFPAWSVPILVADGSGRLRTANLSEPEAQGLLRALGLF
ncbi:MAG: hypothetical protein NUW06_01555 [Candidatus Acetothermia bacterium]|jgi:hypothetical protein|nr:hypothetical protein [Candidatus Acetothermia bacterium]MDH7505325.1 hypothetical protein [Candidatus Acetothermia bacterium]